jgi:rhodanese-related sulfurtransferase
MAFPLLSKLRANVRCMSREIESEESAQGLRRWSPEQLNEHLSVIGDGELVCCDVRDAAELPATGMLPSSVAPLATGEAEDWLSLAACLAHNERVLDARYAVCVDANGSGDAEAVAGELAGFLADQKQRHIEVGVLDGGASAYAQQFETECFLKGLGAE